MKIIKRSLKLIIFILAIFSIEKVSALEPTNQFYVNDYGNLLSESTKEEIMNYSIQLEQKTSAQLVVTTVKSLEGDSIDEYANKLFRDWKIGAKEKNNGVLILISKEDRKIRVEVGYGLEGILTDGLIGRYLDQYAVPYLKDNKWDEGIKNIYKAVYKKLGEYYNLDISDIKVNKNSNHFEAPSVLEIVLAVITAISGYILGSFLRKMIEGVSNILILPIVIISMAALNFSSELSLVPEKLEIYLFVFCGSILISLLDTSGDGSKDSSGGFGGSSGGGGSSRGF